MAERMLGENLGKAQAPDDRVIVTESPTLAQERAEQAEVIFFFQQQFRAGKIGYTNARNNIRDVRREPGSR